MSTLPSKTQTLAGWGNCPSAECLTFRPEQRQELGVLLASPPATLLARGMGRAYGDAALNPAGVVLTERLDRFVHFDAHSGILTAQAGVTLDEVLSFCLPRGFILPVIPGTRFVSLGGALACNVHGKNQFVAGEFAEHVIGFTLRLADGQVFECRRDENHDLFWATAGGLGMTGIIETVSVQLRPITSLSLRATRWRTNNITEMVQAFYTHSGNADYMVGWIDHFSKGNKVGQGIFEHASHIEPEEGGLPLQSYLPPKKGRAIPCLMPSFLLNRYSMALYNKTRFRGTGIHPQQRLLGLNDFFHPLDNLQHWNRLYGKHGFFQYQCILPAHEQTPQVINELIGLLHARHAFSFLAVIKYHRQSAAPMGFSLPGFSLALDFSNTPKVRAALAELDWFVAQQGGRVYLAKDAVLSPELLEGMYPHIGHWREIVRHYDPQGRFSSLLAERLRLRGSA